MITLDTVVAFALRHPVVMDRLGDALRNDLVVANPYYRRLVEFADDFLLQRRKLPGDGDWAMWLDTLPAGLQRDGTREAMGRLLAMDTSGHDPEYFTEIAIDQLRRGAAQVARSRLNAQPELDPELLLAVTKKFDAIGAGHMRGIARLSDVSTWITQPREDEYVTTGFPTLNHLIGGWGKELWIAFADSGMGKSMLLQNFATAAAVRGKHVLHVSLELGIRPQIHRYYRQIALASRGDFLSDPDGMRERLAHWFRLAQGSVHLMEFSAYELDMSALRRTIERANRTIGAVDVLVLDYLDLLAPEKHRRGRSDYEDLGRLTHGSRALCRDFELTVLTVSQAVRRPEKKGRLTVRDMGDSYKKVQGADGLLSLVQTDEEEEMHQGRIGVLKVRDSGGRGREVGVYINRELSVIAELNHPNTIKLMQRVGHMPAPDATGAP